MGVKGLWKLIESAGVPVPLETLEHKILAVDVSIWLHQAVRGFRGPGGAAVANAHLLTLFHRICKLLFYRIRPVFVFDGGVPHLKKQTLASRRLKREVAANKAQQVRKRLLENLLKSQAVRTALGRTGPGPSLALVSRPKKQDKDMFELLPLPKTMDDEGMMSVMSDDSEDEEKVRVRNLKLPNLHQFEIENEEFKSLPIETRHEILSELQDTRKQNSWNCINEMPHESDDFAKFQMNRLLKRSKFQITLDSVREEIRKRNLAQMEEEMFGELEQHVSMSQRIISEDSAHTLFMKKVQPNEEGEKDTKVEDVKGKSPMKKKQKTFGKDFLTELAKQGIVKPTSDSDSDLDDSASFLDYDSEAEKSGNPTGKQMDFEEDFLQIVGTLMENSSLTQDEILTLIRQENPSNTSPPKIDSENNGPSTSQKASGVIFNPDADSSSDDEDFIEVIDTSFQIQSSNKDTQVSKDQIKSNNVDKILNRKSDSLWMKIVQQKLDDMVHVNTLKSSPKKALYDSRRVNGKGMTTVGSKDSGTGNLKSVKISLDFEVKPLKIEDDIFSDIFTEINSKKPVSCPQSTQKNVSVQSSIMPKSHETTESIISPKKTLDTILASKAVSNSDIIHGGNDTAVFSKKQKEPSLEKQISQPMDNDGKSMSLEQKKLAEAVKESSGICTTNEEPDELKNIQVDEALQSRINELVKLEIEKLVKNSQKNDNPTVTGPPITEKYDNDDIEIMSSSDDSDAEEYLAPKSTTNPFEKSEARLSSVTAAVTETTQAQSTSSSETDDDDFIEVPVQENNEKQITSDASNSSSLINNVNENKECNVSESEQKLQRVNAAVTIDNRERTSVDESVMEDLNTENTERLGTNEEVDQNTASHERVNENEEEKVSESEQEDYRWNEAKSGIENVDQVERPLSITDDELKHLEGELIVEQQALVAEAQRTDRVASSLNDQMYGEAQHLLQLFGIPYLVAPMEAEAQCAFLNMVNLAAGTITDDSDIFLFGGSSVYKHFFNQTKYVECYKLDNIKANFGLDRSKMITLAFLTGSDYTEGVESVGAVAAMEILAEFPGDGIECLHAVRKFWNVAHRNVAPTYASKVKQKLSRVVLAESFPNASVYDAYLEPEVDESREKFSWAVPNVEALRTFTMEKFGWNLGKTDEILLPVMKKLGVKTSQRRIDSFFTNIKLVKEDKIPSKRLQEAIARTKGEEPRKSDIEMVKNKHKKPVRNNLQRKKLKSVNNDVTDNSVGSKLADDGDVEAAVEEGDIHPMPLPGSSKPSRTLLIDPSESKSRVSEGRTNVSKPRKERKRKASDSGAEGPCQSFPVEDPTEGLPPPRKLTKEIMYKALLEKGTISQRDAELKKMEEKKLAAAQVLKTKLEKGRSGKR